LPPPSSTWMVPGPAAKRQGWRLIAEGARDALSSAERCQAGSSARWASLRPQTAARGLRLCRGGASCPHWPMASTQVMCSLSLGFAAIFTTLL